MKFRFAGVLLTLMMHTGRQAISQTSEDSFTVFCTGNQDSTGSCFEGSIPDEQKKLDCIMVPGNIIDCKNEAKEKVECILIAATSAQAEFSCNKNNDVSIDSVLTQPIEENIIIQESKIKNTVNGTNQNADVTGFFTDAF